MQVVPIALTVNHELIKDIFSPILANTAWQYMLKETTFLDSMVIHVKSMATSDQSEICKAVKSIFDFFLNINPELSVKVINGICRNKTLDSMTSCADERSVMYEYFNFGLEKGKTYPDVTDHLKNLLTYVMNKLKDDALIYQLNPVNRFIRYAELWLSRRQIDNIESALALACEKADISQQCILSYKGVNSRLLGHLDFLHKCSHKPFCVQKEGLEIQSLIDGDPLFWPCEDRGYGAIIGDIVCSSNYSDICELCSNFILTALGDNLISAQTVVSVFNKVAIILTSSRNQHVKSFFGGYCNVLDLDVSQGETASILAGMKTLISSIYNMCGHSVNQTLPLTSLVEGSRKVFADKNLSHILQRYTALCVADVIEASISYEEELSGSMKHIEHIIGHMCNDEIIQGHSTNTCCDELSNLISGIHFETQKERKMLVESLAHPFGDLHHAESVDKILSLLTVIHNDVEYLTACEITATAVINQISRHADNFKSPTTKSYLRRYWAYLDSNKRGDGDTFVLNVIGLLTSKITSLPYVHCVRQMKEWVVSPDHSSSSDLLVLMRRYVKEERNISNSFHTKDEDTIAERCAAVVKLVHDIDVVQEYDEEYTFEDNPWAIRKSQGYVDGKCCSLQSHVYKERIPRERSSVGDNSAEYTGAKAFAQRCIEDIRFDGVREYITQPLSTWTTFLLESKDIAQCKCAIIAMLKALRILLNDSQLVLLMNKMSENYGIVTEGVFSTTLFSYLMFSELIIKEEYLDAIVDIIRSLPLSEVNQCYPLSKPLMSVAYTTGIMITSTMAFSLQDVLDMEIEGTHGVVKIVDCKHPSVVPHVNRIKLLHSKGVGKSSEQFFRELYSIMLVRLPQKEKDSLMHLLAKAALPGASSEYTWLSEVMEGIDTAEMQKVIELSKTMSITGFPTMG